MFLDTARGKWRHDNFFSEIKDLGNPYDFLNLSENSTEKEIKKAYKKMALKCHPDKIRQNE